MEFTWKKIVGILVVFTLIIVVPLVLISNPMMEFYQRRIDKNPSANSSRWLLLTSANVCYKTMRPEMAADYYQRFLEKYPKDAERPHALLRLGHSLDECNRNADALAVYQQYIEEYPERADKHEAETGINRIRYVKPNR